MIMDMQMNELAADSFKDLREIFQNSPDILDTIRAEYKDDCVGAAQYIKNILNQNGFIAEIITLKNGNAFLDGGIKVSGKVYTHHAIVLLGEAVIDVLNTDNIITTKQYLEDLSKDNPKLRIDYTLSTGWYTAEGYPYNPTIEDLINYRY